MTSPPTMRPNRRPGRPKAADAGDVRSQLRAAARLVFAAYGYEGASITQIAKRAEVAPTAVYHHFGTKEALWEEVFLETMSASYERFESQLLAGTSLHEALKYFLGAETHMPIAFDNSREFLIRCAADMRAFSELEKYRHHRTNAQMKVFRGLTELGIRTGGIHPTRDIDEVTELLRTIVMGHLWERYTHPDEVITRSMNLLAILPEVLGVLALPAR